MAAALRRPLAALTAALLLTWVVGVAGATGWGATVNWSLFGVALVLLVLRGTG